MMKKFLKVSFVVLIVTILSALIGISFYVAFVYFNTKQLDLDESVLSSPSIVVNVYDNQNKPLQQENEIERPYAKIDTLSEETKNAFISIEDKNFYKHHGVNYKRIAKAVFNNLASRKIKEGASTITQQLVKNTYLTSEKTYKRKIQEIALAQKLEKKYSKDQILEFYLNAIYFGNNCYGIESASNFYFSKPAKSLSVEEASLLAGLIKSPTKYCPIRQKENALSRRNLVLTQMNKDGLIGDDTLVKAKSTPINLNIKTERQNKLNTYSQASIDEAENILKLPAQQIALMGYNIYTYYNSEKQSALETSVKSEDVSCDSSAIILNNKTHGVEAYYGNSIYKILDAKRQPGSCLKPILVYTPALNEDIIYPCTQILDEKTVIGDYAPKNVGEKYRGYVSVREALSKSINIPAVKVLSYVGIEKAKAYAQSMGISFDEKDNSYTLALGGMTYGVTPLSLAGAYSTFANNGKYSSPQFVSFITDKNNKLVYMHKPEEMQVIREDCAYLLTDMLKTCAKSGTARKLASLEMDIASKTGTVGKSKSKQNLDAWNVSYTKDTTCVAWLGNLDNTPITYAGGNQPTQIVKNYFTQIHDNSTFEIPSSITEKDIDLTMLEQNHTICLANKYIPEIYTQKELFSKFNLPKTTSNSFVKLEKTIFNSKVEDGKAIITFNAKEFLTYIFTCNGKIIANVEGQKGEVMVKTNLTENEQTIQVEYFYTNSKEIKEFENIKFVKTAPKSHDKWFI